MAGKSAVTRDTAPVRIGGTGLAEERGLALGALAGIRDVDRRGTLVEQRVAPEVRVLGVEVQREIAHRRARAPPAGDRQPASLRFASFSSR